MAFLDTTGSTIRIDAVLTDEGRKKITKGTFKIIKFSLGDDEIDYSMWDKTATEGEEGTAITKTPIFEAFENRTANIHSGLASYGNKDLLWLPMLRINDKVSTSAKQYAMPTERPMPESNKTYVSGTFFYMAANEETALKLVDYFGEEKYVLRDADQSGTKITIESGIDTGNSSGIVHAGTRAHQLIYLMENGLLDNYYYIATDPRFIKALYTPNKESYFRNSPNGVEETKIGPLVETKYTTLAPPVSDRQNFISRGILNEIYDQPGADSPGIALSSFSGPRGSATAFNFQIAPELTTTSFGERSYKYSTYGQIEQYITNTTDKYDIIDIPVTVEGTNSARMLNLHVRLARYAGTQ